MVSAPAQNETFGVRRKIRTLLVLYLFYSFENHYYIKGGGTLMIWCLVPMKRLHTVWPSP